MALSGRSPEGTMDFFGDAPMPFRFLVYRCTSYISRCNVYTTP